MFAVSPAIAGDWQGTQWNSGVKLKSTATGFKFEFPGGNSHVNSMQRKQAPIAPRKTITFACRLTTISGQPQFQSLDPAPAPPALPPNCRILLQRKGDDWTCANGKEHYRWWSAGALCVFLKADGQIYSYSVKLIPANWSNCWGKMASQYPAEFKAALKNLDNVQIVFGGGNSFSHGVRVKNGRARYELLSYAVQ